MERKKSDHCECCYYDTEDLTLSCDTPGVERLWICQLCSGSLAGNVAIYHKLYGGDMRIVVGVVMNAANNILREIKESRKP